MVVKLFAGGSRSLSRKITEVIQEARETGFFGKLSGPAPTVQPLAGAVLAPRQAAALPSVQVANLPSGALQAGFLAQPAIH